jgi:hypothetical protein
VRSAFASALDGRWQKLRVAAAEAIGARFANRAHAITHAAMTGEEPSQAFRSWLDEALRQIVMGGSDGLWVSRYVRQGAAIGQQRAASMLATDGFDPDEQRDDHGRWTAAAAAYQENPADDRARAVLTRLSAKTTSGGGREDLHPGAITVYRAGRIGKKGTSFSKSREQARRQLFEGESEIRSIKLTKSTPAIDLNKLNPGSRYTHEQEVFVDTRKLRVHDAAQDRTSVIVALTASELQGICDAVSQQATRAFAEADIAQWSASRTTQAVGAVIRSVGVQRSRAMAEFMVVRAHALASLDAFRAAGVTTVGTQAERVRARTSSPPLTRDAKRKKRKFIAEQVEVLTAGDDEVCQDCQDISEGGPYDIDEADLLIPAHPRCRCAFVPVGDRRFATVRDAFNPDEPRDDHGQWTGGSAGDFSAMMDKSLRGDPVTPAEASSVKYYCADGYKSINNALRSDARLPHGDADKTAVSNMDQLLGRASLAQDVVATRLVPPDVYQMLSSNSGKIFMDRGYVSTSVGGGAFIDRNMKKGYQSVDVIIPRGSRALPIGHLSNNSDEKELVIARGSSYVAHRRDGRLTLEVVQ